MGPGRLCQVCKETQSKYKCPLCLAPYCSVICFKKHKEIPCSKPVPLEEKPSSIQVVERPFQVDESSEVLQKIQLESIVASSEIHEALKDEELQKLIYKIDCSTDVENELEKAMEMEAFRKFTEKILSVVSP